jgi:hypothetical protein
MRKTSIILLCILLVGLSSCEKTTTDDKTTVQTEPIEIEQYSSVLDEYYGYLNDGDGYLITRYYAFYDIDGDGTKEFMLGADSGNDGQSKPICEVYSIQNGSATRQNDYPLWMEFYPPTVLLKNGTIRKSGTDEVGLCHLYYRLEDGELKLQKLLIDNTLGYGYFRREYGNKDIPITKAEFERLKAEMEGDGQIVKLDWKPLAEYGK